jgi:ubiquinone/menaquinone biosynthesis C-methylase UbiE
MEKSMAGGISIEKATLYEKYRLPYADEMVTDLSKRIGNVEVVADIGAGTGQLARMFASRCAKVYAVEPDPAMRKVAATSLAGLPTVEILAGSAEQTTLAENSIDLIVVGNAFHRFRPEACAELCRILKEQGWIALVTYTFLNQAFTDMLSSNLTALQGLTRKIEKSWHRTPVQNLFGDGQIHTLSYPQSHTEDWTAFFGAACAGIEAPERADRGFAQFEATNRDIFGAFAVDGKIQIDYETRVQFGQPHPS